MIFDWDLTLWNSWNIHIQGVRYIADSLGLARPSRNVVAEGYHGPLDEHLSGLFTHDPIEVMDCYMKFYKSNLRKLGHLYEGIAETLSTLKKHGYAIAILSDKCRVYGDIEIDLTGIATVFDHVQFMEDGLAYKPEPEGLIRIIERFSVLRAQVLFVGDSPTDIECAQRAGVECAAALWGSVSVQETLGRGPDQIWHSISEMKSALVSGDA